VYGQANHPVTCVTWYDALYFCDWLTNKMLTDVQAESTQNANQWIVRLPSEAEWEKAGRGTDGRLYPWGNQAPDASLCNFNSTLGDTTLVGKYSPGGDSPYGAADMAGNVWEWMRSLWGKDFSKPDFKYPYRTDDGRENLDASKQIPRVLRGGSFRDESSVVRCAGRGGSRPFFYYGDNGFRVVVVAPSL
jgi:iron(II)-dependent oxidoreductase